MSLRRSLLATLGQLADGWGPERRAQRVVAGSIAEAVAVDINLARVVLIDAVVIGVEPPVVVCVTEHPVRIRAGRTAGVGHREPQELLACEFLQNARDGTRSDAERVAVEALGHHVEDREAVVVAGV